MKTLIKIAWRNIWRNKRRTLITVASIMFALFFAIIMRGFGKGSYAKMKQNAIEAIGRGEALLDPAVTQRVFQEVRKAAREEEASAFAELTQQEMHVLQLVSEGRTNRQIAEMLFLGEGTVRNYVSSILSKLNVRNRAEAAAYAVEHNLKDYL